MHKVKINQSDDQDNSQSVSFLSKSNTKEKNQNNNDTPSGDPTTNPLQIQQIAHKVQYGDTLEGLSLQYSVPISKIKSRNQIDGDNIYHLKHIIIPNPMVIPPAKDKTEALLIQEFNSYMDYSQKDRKIARYYLSENNWDMASARKQYKQDLQWQKKNKLTNTGGNDVKNKIQNYFYMDFELKEKKKK